MAKSHGSRLEDVSNLRIDCRVVPSPVVVGAISTICFVVDRSIGELAGKKDRHPLIVDDVLVGGDGELPSTVEHPLVILIELSVLILHQILSNFPRPVLMHTEPQDTHGEKEGILITSRISNSCDYNQ